MCDSPFTHPAAAFPASPPVSLFAASYPALQVASSSSFLLGSFAYLPQSAQFLSRAVDPETHHLSLDHGRSSQASHEDYFEQPLSAGSWPAMSHQAASDPSRRDTSANIYHYGSSSQAHPTPPLSPFLAPTSQLLSSTLAQAAGMRLPSIPSGTQQSTPPSTDSSPSAQGPLPRIYQCEECGRAFARNHDLTRHRKSHLGIKPHRCKYCNRGFTRGDALRRHAANTGCGTDETGMALSQTPPPEFELSGRASLAYYQHQASASAPPDLCSLHSYPSESSQGGIPATYIPGFYYSHPDSPHGSSP